MKNFLLFRQTLSYSIRLASGADDGRGATLAAINARLADHIVGINGKLELPWKFVLSRLNQGEKK